VDGARDQFFSGPGFAQDQHDGIGRACAMEVTTREFSFLVGPSSEPTSESSSTDSTAGSCGAYRRIDALGGEAAPSPCQVTKCCRLNSAMLCTGGKMV